VSPTVLRVGGYRFYFFSREESRPHVHVQCGGGEAKIWLEPRIMVASNSGLTATQLKAALRIVEGYQDEIREAWKTYFGG
jgi:hypothetical protein